MMLKLEISQATIKDAPVETKAKLTNDLMRLLQVREKNEAMAKDWLLFIATSKFNKLTAGEIYNAFKLAMSRELKDSKGNDFELLPELSNNTTAKVLTAYMDLKLQNNEYHKAKLQLKPKEEVSDEEKRERREKYILMVFEDMIEKGYSPDAWLLFDELESSGKVLISLEDKIKLYKEQEKIYFQEIKAEYNSNPGVPQYKHSFTYIAEQIQKGKKNRVVQNRCRSIMVCEYLKAHLKDFETFKTALS